MLRPKKVYAFTLSEMSVVLLITSLVVGLAFTALGLVQKQMSALHTNFTSALEVNMLETTIWLDFNRYPNISYNSITQELVLKNELDMITYTFSAPYVIKNQDTLLVQIDRKQFYFDGKQVTTNSVDAVKLITTKAFQKRTLFVYIKNDATTYINSMNFIYD